MKLSYEELEKEWHEAVERNIKYYTALQEIVIESESIFDGFKHICKIINRKAKQVLDEVGK